MLYARANDLQILTLQTGGIAQQDLLPLFGSELRAIIIFTNEVCIEYIAHAVQHCPKLHTIAFVTDALTDQFELLIRRISEKRPELTFEYIDDRISYGPSELKQVLYHSDHESSDHTVESADSCEEDEQIQPLGHERSFDYTDYREVTQSLLCFLANQKEHRRQAQNRFIHQNLVLSDPRCRRHIPADVRQLLAMYLTDPKTGKPEQEQYACIRGIFAQATPIKNSRRGVRVVQKYERVQLVKCNGLSAYIPTDTVSVQVLEPKLK